MINRNDRISDIIKSIEKLDISPTMFKDATEKYKSIANYLGDNGIEADFFPQGSFSLGTVVRPYKDCKDANFDLDAICQFKIVKEETSPKEAMEKVEDIFSESELYKKKLAVDNKCCTIKYADENDIGFSIDIVPAVDEDFNSKIVLKSKSNNPDLLDTAIAITDNNDGEYSWATNNPKGFKQWFENINKPFLENSSINNRIRLFDEYKVIFASIEEIPLELERSSLQRVIQILKRHRDVYFSHKNNGDNLKPKSCIITTIVASICQSAPTSLGIYDLLQFVLNEFGIYSNHLELDENLFANKYRDRNIIKRVNGEWIIENPANPDDNLASSWNEDDGAKVKAFFKWSEYLVDDLINSLTKSDEQFGVILERAFGMDFIMNNIDVAKYSKKDDTPQIILKNNQSQPWGN